MNNKRDVFRFDRWAWVVAIIILVSLAFIMLRRDATNKFGAVSFGFMPRFHFDLSNGEILDEHRIKGNVWALHAIVNNGDVQGIIEKFKTVVSQTTNGKHQLHVLMLGTQPNEIPTGLNPPYYFVLTTPVQISQLLKGFGVVHNSSVFLVDQNAIIRGMYDFDKPDDLRKFGQDVLHIL